MVLLLFNNDLSWKPKNGNFATLLMEVAQLLQKFPFLSFHLWLQPVAVVSLRELCCAGEEIYNIIIDIIIMINSMIIIILINIALWLHWGVNLIRRLHWCHVGVSNLVWRLHWCLIGVSNLVRRLHWCLVGVSKIGIKKSHWCWGVAWRHIAQHCLAAPLS